jgi:hypothetical protein
MNDNALIPTLILSQPASRASQPRPQAAVSVLATKAKPPSQAI